MVHWNLGSKKWQNKLDIMELLLEEHKPDLCYIYEANLQAGLEEHEMSIPNHYLIVPNTMVTLGHARIVLIVREGFTVTKLDNLMDKTVATIWVKIGSGKKTSLQVG